MTHELLNPSQRLALAIALRRVEQALRGILDGLNSEKQAILYRVEGTLPEDRRIQVIQLAESGLQQIAWMTHRFELPPRIFDNLASIRGSLAILGSDLYDVHAQKLQRYGDVDPSLQAELDPAIDDLIRQLEEIVRVAQP